MGMGWCPSRHAELDSASIKGAASASMIGERLVPRQTALRWILSRAQDDDGGGLVPQPSC